MIFLEGLMTFKRPLSFGKEIIKCPRTIKGLILKDQPRVYMSHQTKAGLYIVLPHNSDKSLFVYPGQKNVSYEKDWNGIHTANNFMLTKTYQKRVNGKVILASNVSKNYYDSKIQMGVNVDVGYLVNQEGEISSMRIGYKIIQKNVMTDSRIDFEIYRSILDNSVSVEGPKITNWEGLNFDKLQIVNQEKTLENLVDLILPVKIKQKSLFSLFDFDYVEKMYLH